MLLLLLLLSSLLIEEDEFELDNELAIEVVDDERDLNDCCDADCVAVEVNEDEELDVVDSVALNDDADETDEFESFKACFSLASSKLNFNFSSMLLLLNIFSYASDFFFWFFKI